jgi:transposase
MSLVAPYLMLPPENAGQREHSLREAFSGLQYRVKTDVPWRWMPQHLPPWHVHYQQAQHWLWAGCFKELVHNLRFAACRKAESSAAVLDNCTLRSTTEIGHRAGYIGDKRKSVQPMANRLRLTNRDGLHQFVLSGA